MKKIYILIISLSIIALSLILIINRKDFEETKLIIKNNDTTITATKLQYEEDKDAQYAYKDILEYKSSLESMNISIENTDLDLEFKPSVLKDSKGFAIYIIEVDKNEVINLPATLDAISLPTKVGEYIIDYMIFNNKNELVRYGFRIVILE